MKQIKANRRFPGGLFHECILMAVPDYRDTERKVNEKRNEKVSPKNGLFRTLAELRGNPAPVFYRTDVGLSMNLCLPYATVYMLHLV